jgi:hypothetical protein
MNTVERCVFDIERDMWIPATKWLVAQNCDVKREFRTPWGICDLVGVQWAPDRVADRIGRRQFRRIGSARRVAILQSIPDVETGSIAVKELSAVLRLEEHSVEDDLAFLERGRFICRHVDGSVSSSIPWAPVYEQLIMIELKLNRVEEAIAQARSHLAIATASFVGLPTTIAQRLNDGHRASLLDRAGVGLLAISEKGATLLRLPPGESGIPVDPVLQMYSAERFWCPFTGRTT